MPAIHICDADEEATFRANLQQKINMAAVSRTQEKDDGNQEAELCLSPAAEDLPSRSSPQGCPFGDGETGGWGHVFGGSDKEMSVRRHSDLPCQSSTSSIEGPEGATPLCKSVTLSDMTDTNGTQVLVLSLESPSSPSSISESEDTALKTATLQPVGPAKRTNSCQPDTKSVATPVTHYRNVTEKNGADISQRYLVCDKNVHYNTPADRSKISENLQHQICRRRSEPAKTLDLNKLVESGIVKQRFEEGISPSSSSKQCPSQSQSDNSTETSHTPPNMSMTPAKSSAVKSFRDQQHSKATFPHGKDTYIKDKQKSKSNGTASNRARTSGSRTSSASSNTSDGDDTSSRRSSCTSTSIGRLDNQGATPSGRTSRIDVTRKVPRGPPAADKGQQSLNINTDSLSKVDLDRIRQNGRLVIYFKGRPRSMSPSLRIHPLTVPEGSRSLRDSPFSSPRMGQKLHSLQGELLKDGQDAFFRHIRLRRRDLFQ